MVQLWGGGGHGTIQRVSSPPVGVFSTFVWFLLDVFGSWSLQGLRFIFSIEIWLDSSKAVAAKEVVVNAH